MPFVYVFAAILFLFIIVLSAAVVVFFNIALVRRPYVDHTDDPHPEKYGERGRFFAAINAGEKWFLSHYTEIVTTVAYDGLKLSAYRFDVPGSDRLIICFHGYRSAAFHDFGVVSKQYTSMGYNLLAVDQRSHGNSDGKYIGFGVPESRDVLTWIEYARRIYGDGIKIWLDGISMGASTVMFAAGSELPDNVRGIIADCGFTSPKEIMTHVLRRDYHLPPFPLINLISPLSKLIAGYAFDEISSLDTLRQNKIPLLLLHGSADTFVPTEMTYRNREASAAPTTMLIVEGAGHGLSYLVDTERCIEVLEKFFADTADDTECGVNISIK